MSDEQKNAAILEYSAARVLLNVRQMTGINISWRRPSWLPKNYGEPEMQALAAEVRQSFPDYFSGALQLVDGESTLSESEVHTTDQLLELLDSQARVEAGEICGALLREFCSAMRKPK